jgi:predicted nucleotidyltransferase
MIKISELEKSFKSGENLCPLFFDEDGKINTEVRKQLLDITNNFIDFLKIEVKPTDILLVGSLANYNWNKFSDIDLHVEFDFKEINEDIELVSEFMLTKKTLWNFKHDVKIFNYDVEVYGQPNDSEVTSSGIYSILNNKWINVPKKPNYDFSIRRLVKKAAILAQMAENIIKSVEGNEEKLKKINILVTKIYKYRLAGLEENGEFSDENLVFKILRRVGFIDKIKQYIIDIEDKKLTLQ